VKSLEIAEKSPEAVGRHDREAWIALFTQDAEVHDPIGARGHPRSRLGAFWDVFIAANGIRFEVHQDLVEGDLVVRDVTIHTTLSTGAVLKVPAHLRYEISGDRVRRLYAHWELLPMVWATTLLGPLAWWSSTWMFLRMLRHLGFGGTWAYLQGVRGVGSAGKRRLQAWAEAEGVEINKVIAAGEHVTASLIGGGVVHMHGEDVRVYR